MAEPKLADDYELPQCSFPIEGFVEPPCAEYPNPNKYDEGKAAKVARARIEDSDEELDHSDDEDVVQDDEDSDDEDAQDGSNKKRRTMPMAISGAEKTSLEACLKAIAMRRALFPNSDSEDDDEGENPIAKEEEEGDAGLFD